MIAGRLLGWVLIFLALAVAGRDAMAMIDRGQFGLIKLGEFWFQVSPASLNGLQAGVERYLTPLLWDWILAPLLHLPLVLVFLVPGLLLAFFFRKKCPGRKSRRLFRRGH
jgi:hypothetical protein